MGALAILATVAVCCGLCAIGAAVCEYEPKKAANSTTAARQVGRIEPLTYIKGIWRKHA